MGLEEKDIDNQRAALIAIGRTKDPSSVNADATTPDAAAKNCWLSRCFDDWVTRTCPGPGPARLRLDAAQLHRQQVLPARRVVYFLSTNRVSAVEGEGWMDGPDPAVKNTKP